MSTQNIIVFGLAILLLSVDLASAQTDSLYHDGRWRTYLLHVPPSYDGMEAVPLVIGLHGGFGSGQNFENQTLMSEKSDEEGFIGVYPDGIGFPRTWNAGTCCGPAMNQDVDDVGFVSALIDTLAAEYNIDLTRIYATGMSNGAMMAYRLGCELADRIAAIAPVAGSLMMETCLPSRPLSVAHFHSLLDTRVPFEGGFGDGFTQDIWKPAIDSVMEAWAVMNGCTQQPDTIYQQDGVVGRRWGNCEGGAEVIVYVTADGGHSWPGGNRGFPGADPPSEAISATDLMWEFFEEHSLSGMSANPEATSGIASNAVLFPAYPNPFNPVTTIRFELMSASYVSIDIYDISGRRVIHLIGELRSSGMHQIEFNGSGLSSGIYLVRLEVGDYRETQKIILLK